MRRTALAALLLAAAASPAAAVTFDFTPETYAISAPGPFGPPPKMEFKISAAAVARGSFTLSAAPHNGSDSLSPINFSGDLADFIQLQVGTDLETPNYVFGSFSIAFTFDAAGNVTSSAFQFFGTENGAQLFGTGETASGTYGTDAMSCTDGGRITCSTSGFWRDPPDAPSPAPEPASLGLLAVPLMAIGRRRVYAALASRRRAWRIHSV